jgi:hypothetical protein
VKKIKTRDRFVKYGSLTAVVLLVSAGGAVLQLFSSASTDHNPFGYADTCTISGKTTEIIGWGYDADAGTSSFPNVLVTLTPAGGQAMSVTAPTNISGYRDTPINAGIDKDHAGDPHTGEYGFVAQFNGLINTVKYTISGTILNYGSGSNVALPINNNHNVDGDTTKPYFTDNLVPAACLPVPAQVIAQTTPTVTTVYVPAKTTTTVKPTASTVKSTTASTPVAKPTPAISTPTTLSAQPTITAGTLGASLSVPDQGNGTIQVTFGTDPNNLSQNVQQPDIAGQATAINLTGLKAGTTYFYQINYASSGGSTSQSNVSSFVTSNYKVLVTVRAGSVTLKGARISLQNSKTSATTNAQGQATLSDVADGAYELQTNYQGQTEIQKIDVDSSQISANQQNSSSQATVSQDIDFQLTATKHTNPFGAILSVLLLILLLGGLAFFILRRRKPGSRSKTRPQNPLPGITNLPSTPVPQHQAPLAQPVPTQVAAPLLPLPLVQQPLPGQPSASTNVNPAAPHAGESLRDMVVRSMAEEAKRRKDASGSN